MRFLPVCLSFLIATGCIPVGTRDSADSDADIETDTDDLSALDTGDTIVLPPVGIHGVIEGTVDIQVFTTDANGDLVLLDWDVAYPDGSFPYGSLFVAAYGDDEKTGHRTYISQYSIPVPAPGPNSYRLELDNDLFEEVNLFAALDYWREGVIGTGDPVGFYPKPISVVDGGTVPDVDMELMTTIIPKGGGEGCDAVYLSGDINLGNQVQGGQIGTMLLGLDGSGPWHNWVGWLGPDPSGVTPYSQGACVNDGEGRLVGAWDSNLNGILDPMDAWGAYASKPDVDGNPVTVGTVDQSGLDIQIPLGDDGPIQVVPWVHLSGEVTSGNKASFDSLPDGATLYVVALKRWAEGDIAVADLEEGYDMQVIPWEDLQGRSSAPFSLTVSTNTIVYLWAYTDNDGDGMVNEPLEALGVVSGTDRGRLGTGTLSQTGLGIPLMIY